MNWKIVDGQMSASAKSATRSSGRVLFEFFIKEE